MMLYFSHIKEKVEKMNNDELRNDLEDRIIKGEQVSSDELKQLKFIELQGLCVTCFGGVLHGKTKTEIIDRIKSKFWEW